MKTLFRLLIWVLIVAVLISCLGCSDTEPFDPVDWKQNRNRKQMVHSLMAWDIKQGMTRMETRRLLGAPDDENKNCDRFFIYNDPGIIFDYLLINYDSGDCIDSFVIETTEDTR
ncbi:MAG: hypothetical protein SFX18_06735 [Pirellulales bacterium]|nr:hypothetical protein [Pirellulales bacterium]